MDFPTSEIVGVVYALLPGFLAAWIFYGLTAHPRKSPFERVIEALIFTGIIKAFVVFVRFTSLLILGFIGITSWSTDVEFVFSIAVALPVGLLFALCANKDWFHRFLREYWWFSRIGGITKRTSFPSEWFSAFNRDKRYVVLHLEGERRLYGWPFEWPDSSESGHFVIVEAEWLLDNNERMALTTVDRILIPAKDVRMVEFEKFAKEIEPLPIPPADKQDSSDVSG